MKKIIFIINKKYVIYAKKSFLIDKNDKNYINKKKVRDHEHYTGKSREAAYSICNLNYNDQKEIPIIIHSITYDTHFILNQLAIKIKGELNCLGDDMEKYITFSVPIKKEVNNYDGNDSKKRKQLHTNLNLLIVLDLCQLHYQNLLITHLEFLIV